MARLTSLILLGAAVASAHPGHHHHHAHKHRAVAEKRAEGDEICAEINGVRSCWTQVGDYYSGEPASSPVPAATTTPAASYASFAVPKVNAAAPIATTLSTKVATAPATYSTQGASSGSTTKVTSSSTKVTTTGYTVDTYTDFSAITCDEKRATLAQITQVGNTGGSCYGSNFLVLADADLAAKYDNTIRFHGAKEDLVCAYWSKASRTGAVNGWYKDMDSYFTFDLPANGELWLAAEDGSNGGASCFPKSSGIEFDAYGAIGGTWLEFTFIDVTTGWSAYDASCIIAENGGITITGLEVCQEDGSMCSSIGAGLSSIYAAFNAALAAADGIGGNVDGNVKIAANWGF